MLSFAFANGWGIMVNVQSKILHFKTRFLPLLTYDEGFSEDYALL